MQEFQNNSAQANTTANHRPWWLAVLVILAGAICIYSASGLSVTAQYAAIGPGLFLFAIGGLLCFFGLLLLMQIARGEKFEAQDTEDSQGSTPMDKKAFIIVFVATLLPGLLIETIGLPLTAMLSFTLVTYAFGSKAIAINMILGFMVGCVSWGLFSYLGLQLGGFIPILGE